MYQAQAEEGIQYQKPAFMAKTVNRLQTRHTTTVALCRVFFIHMLLLLFISFMCAFFLIESTRQMQH